jgi:hypothetical protein
MNFKNIADKEGPLYETSLMSTICHFVTLRARKPYFPYFSMNLEIFIQSFSAILFEVKGELLYGPSFLGSYHHFDSPFAAL